jgi:hypothetical protein
LLGARSVRLVFSPIRLLASFQQSTKVKYGFQGAGRDMFKQTGVLLFAVSLTTVLPMMRTCIAGEATELVIDNSPQKIADGEIKAELRGVRVVTTSDKFLQSAPYGVTVPKNVVVEAVKGSEDLRKTLELWSNDPKELTFPKIAEAARLAQEKGVTWKPTNRPIAGIYCGIQKGQDKEGAWQNLSCDSAATYNSEAVAQLLVRGGLETNEDVKTNVDGNSIDLVAVRPAFAFALITGNKKPVLTLNYPNDLPDYQTNPPAAAEQTGLNLGDTIVKTHNSDNIKDVVFEQKNIVTFGTPIVDAPIGSNSKVPKLISEKYDIYIIQLAMTWRDLPREDLNELGFLVEAPSDTIALALMPLKYGIQVEEKSATRISPSVEALGVKVDLGDIYGRDISFNYLKPTIQAYGLQESHFSWTLRDQAVLPGAERFVCAIGVPKHSKQLTLVMSAYARWPAGMFIAGGVEKSDDKIVQVPLQ